MWSETKPIEPRTCGGSRDLLSVFFSYAVPEEQKALCIGLNIVGQKHSPLIVRQPRDETLFSVQNWLRAVREYAELNDHAGCLSSAEGESRCDSELIYSCFSCQGFDSYQCQQSHNYPLSEASVG